MIASHRGSYIRSRRQQRKLSSPGRPSKPFVEPLLTIIAVGAKLDTTRRSKITLPARGPNPRMLHTTEKRELGRHGGTMDNGNTQRLLAWQRRWSNTANSIIIVGVVKTPTVTPLNAQSKRFPCGPGPGPAPGRLTTCCNYELFSRIR